MCFGEVQYLHRCPQRLPIQISPISWEGDKVGGMCCKFLNLCVVYERCRITEKKKLTSKKGSWGIWEKCRPRHPRPTGLGRGSSLSTGGVWQRSRLFLGTYERCDWLEVKEGERVASPLYRLGKSWERTNSRICPQQVLYGEGGAI